MKILFYNIAHARGVDGTFFQYATRTWKYIAPGTRFLLPISDFIASVNPDIACFVEVDKNQAEFFKKQNGFRALYSMNQYAAKSFSQYLPVFKNHHLAILAKSTMADAKSHYFPKGLQKGIARISFPSGLTLLLIHLSFMRSIRRTQLQELNALLRQIDAPFLVCGDFNVMKGIHELDGLVQKNALSLIAPRATFPSCSPRYILDLFLASPGIQIKSAKAFNVMHSDHLPIMIDIELLNHA